jgi:hypothetical protein
MIENQLPTYPPLASSSGSTEIARHASPADRQIRYGYLFISYMDRDGRDIKPRNYNSVAPAAIRASAASVNSRLNRRSSLISPPLQGELSPFPLSHSKGAVQHWSAPLE